MKKRAAMLKYPASVKRSGKVRLAILGTGGMANHHADQYKQIKGCEMVAAADVDPVRVAAYCEKHGIPQGFSSVDELLAGAEFDAVVIVTPDAFHAPLSIRCLEAGKHVLCEKPLALNHAEARKMVAAATKAGKINMVNFSYRNWPAIHAVAKVVRDGKLGDLRHVEASYLQTWLTSKAWGDWTSSPNWLWRLSTRHGSQGTLGDIGVHILDFATYPAGRISELFCNLKAFPKAPGNRIGKFRLDANDSAVLNVTFANGALGTIHTTRWASGHPNRLYLKISGTRGTVEIDSERSTESYRICAGRDLDRIVWKDVKAPKVLSNYQRFIKAIQTGVQEQPDFARGAEIQKLLDASFESDRKGRPVRIPNRVSRTK
ncbi:MAG: Gfo/Idh/MocA family oxidoreductase [Opitutaceae bacterium]